MVGSERSLRSLSPPPCGSSLALPSPPVLEREPSPPPTDTRWCSADRPPGRSGGHTYHAGVPDAKQIVLTSISGIIERRSADAVEVPLDANLVDDLELDSLELAELSALLEDELGTDPYSAGIVPRTVREILEFYSAC